MSKSSTILDTAIDAVRALPKETQEAIAHDLIDEVEHYASSSLTEAERAVVHERLQKPMATVSAEAVTRTLERFKPTI